MKISVIIPTKNREKDLLLLLKSLNEQTRIPDEIVIVECEQKNKNIADFLASAKYKSLYLLSDKQGLTYQRNYGVQRCSGDIIVFFDDDIILEEQFIAEIARVFKEQDGVGGVMGKITNYDRSRRVSWPIKLLRKVFLLSDLSKNGKFKLSGFSTDVNGLPELTETQFLSGGLTAYYKSAFNEVGGSDEKLERYGYCEDEDLSRRVSEKYKNFYTPLARCVHNESPASRDNYDKTRKMLIKHRAYLFKKNFAKTPFHFIFFWWAVLGLLLYSIYCRDLLALKGYLQGVFSIIRKDYP